MPSDRSSWITRRVGIHYAWVIAAVTFVVLIVTAGIRATPGVLMVPLEMEFGWRRTVLSFAVAINIALFGLIGPFAASVIDRFGLRRVVLSAIALLAVAVALTTRMQHRVATGPALGCARRHWNRRHLARAGGDRGDTLVRRPTRAGGRTALGSKCHGTTDLPALAGVDDRVSWMALRSARHVGRGRRDLLRRPGVDA